MTSRHSRGGVQTIVDPHDEPDRWTNAPSGQTGPRHQSPANGRHGGGPGQQPFGAFRFGSDSEKTVQSDGTPPSDSRPSDSLRPSEGPGVASTGSAADTLARSPVSETPPLGSDARTPDRDRVSDQDADRVDERPHRPTTSTRPGVSSSRSSVTAHRTPGTSTPPRRWPWIALAAAALLVGLLIGRASAPASTTATAAPPAPVTVTAPPPSAAPPVPSKVALPSVSGKNGAIVADQLHQLGFQKVQFASNDDDDTVVLDPANWTAKKIEPSVGSKVATDATVVVTMTKQN